MTQKSCIVGLPVVPFNQSRVGDVVQYLQWLEDFLSKVFQDQVTFIYIFPFHSQYFPDQFSTKETSPPKSPFCVVIYCNRFKIMNGHYIQDFIHRHNKIEAYYYLRFIFKSVYQQFIFWFQVFGEIMYTTYSIFFLKYHPNLYFKEG